MVISAFAEAKDERQRLETGEIELDIDEIRPVDPADNHEIVAAIIVEGREQLADLAPSDPGVRKTLDLLRRLATDSDDVQGKSSRRRRLCEHTRKQASSSYDPKRACYLARYRSKWRRIVTGRAVRHGPVRRIGAPSRS